MTNEASTLMPDVPQLPQSAIDFAKAVGSLAEQHNIESATITLRVDTGYYSPFKGTKVQRDMTVNISRVDGRGRPRMKLSVSCDMKIVHSLVNEMDSTD